MKRTVAEIENCKDGLCLPDKAENTLLVFKKAELLQKQLLELEQVYIYTVCTHKHANTIHTMLSIMFVSSQLALEYSIEVQETSVPPLYVTPLSAPPLTGPTLSVPPTITEEDTQVRRNSMLLELCWSRGSNCMLIIICVQESGQIQIVHVEEDVLKKSGATLMTVEQSTPEQRLTWISDKSSHSLTETQVWELRNKIYKVQYIVMA